MNAYERKFIIDDVLWTDSVKPFFKEELAEPLENSSEPNRECAPSNSAGSCSICKVDIEGGRESFVSHYRTDWHKFNLRKFMRKKAPVDEATFEEILSEDELSDAVLSMDEEDEDSSSSEATAKTVLNGCKDYFRSGGHVMSMYKAIRTEGQALGDVLDKKTTCAIFMLTGGHFAAAVYYGGDLIVHKTFHRYVVRAKQGGVQSVMDNRNGQAKSAGSNIRRQNEKLLKEDIGDLIKSWKEDFLSPATMPIIFIRCSTYNSSVFVSSTPSATSFEKGDKRIRTIPFETKRATLDEIRRVYQQLRTVYDHGEAATFEKRLNEEVQRRAKKIQKRLQRQTKKQGREIRRVEDEDSDSSEERDHPIRAMIRHATGAVRKMEIEPPKVDGFPEELIKRIYEAVAGDRPTELNLIGEMFPGNLHAKYYAFLRGYRIPPLGNTYLHIAAAKGAFNVVQTENSLLRSEGFGIDRFELSDKGEMMSIAEVYRLSHSTTVISNNTTNIGPVGQTSGLFHFFNVELFCLSPVDF
ncbi:hypothetical protein L596_030672 [Steinernema carpocapsae]|uniref:VLRF1 domain-containing protein n=1 Tax=Steinernema carpocapsae TaxID=34508 RepID=A0A4U5LQ51_STECR|nr:hypothetical protein L596_030672 [Steinernema carpocapsae]